MTHVAQSDGSERLEIAPTEPGELTSALEWSADGAAALYYSFDGLTPDEIRRVDIASGDERLVAQGSTSATWSDDGTSVLYGGGSIYGGPFEYRLVDPDGSDELLFVVSDWSIEVMKPSSGWLAYVDEGALRYFDQGTRKSLTAWKDTPEEWIVDWASWDRPLGLY